MRRWHEELPLMLRRWRDELHKHDLDPAPYLHAYRNGESAQVAICHCEKGPGVLRKRDPLGLRPPSLRTVSLVESPRHPRAKQPGSICLAV